MPIYNSLEILESCAKSIEKERSKISDINTCTKSKDKNDFNHTEKNHSVEEFIKHKNANGLVSINIWIII